MTIASIIALIRSFEDGQKWAINRVEYDKKEIKVSQGFTVSSEEMGQIRTALLHTILEQLKIPLYKDDDFLSEKIKYEVFL